MNKTLRDYFDVDIAFASSHKQKGRIQRLAQPSAPSFSVESQPVVGPGLYQRVLDFLYEMIKPLLRPLASKIRRYLTDQLRLEIYSSQQRTVELLRQSIRESLEQNSKSEQRTPPQVVLNPGHVADPTLTIGGSAPSSALEPALAACLHEACEQGAGLRLLLQRLLLPGDCFVDICECIGVHTIAAAHAVGGTGMVVSFSPLSFLKVQRHCPTAQDDHSAGEECATVEAPPAAVFTCGCAVVPAPQQGCSTLEAALPSGAHVRVVHFDAVEILFDILNGSTSFMVEHPDTAFIVKLASARPHRPGKSTVEILNHMRSLGLEGRRVDHATGALGKTLLERQDGPGAAYAFFARPESPLWAMAELRQ